MLILNNMDTKKTNRRWYLKEMFYAPLLWLKDPYLAAE